MTDPRPNPATSHGGDRLLTRPLLAGGSLRAPWVLLPAGIAIFCAVGAFNASGKDDPYLLFMWCGVAGGAAVVATAATVLALRRRCWVAVTLDGFVLLGRGTRQTIPDDRVLGVGQTWSQDGEGGWRVDAILETDLPVVRRLAVCHQSRASQPNPLQPLLTHLSQRILQRTLEGFPRGATLRGDGWQL